MKIAAFQFNSIIGDIKANADCLLNAIIDAKSNNADLFLCPELALCGYPPEDLLYRQNFAKTIESELQKFFIIGGITLIIPLPYYFQDTIYNSVVIIRDGEIIGRYYKHNLPNYGVFDDKRYFIAGDNVCVFMCQGIKVGLIICEDVWFSEPALQAKLNGAELLCVINASPFEEYKYEERLNTVRQRVLETHMPILYVNSVGAQDEIIYDGASFMLDIDGDLCYQALAFKQTLDYIDYVHNKLITAPIERYPNYEKRIYNALVLAVTDYVHKNGFKGIVLGLSGGIDSALTLAIAVDALGAQNVTAVMMPSVYTDKISIEDSREMVRRLSVNGYHEIPITPIFEQFKHGLANIFAGLASDTTEENLQARTRGALLMAISNKFGYLVLTTGNKSEMATGYATLYGDMAGGFAVLKDVLKTSVYRLSKWRNSLSAIIPERIITRLPSAELRPNQIDQDSLPKYEILDEIIRGLVDENISTDSLIDKGFSATDVLKTAKLLESNEYKRKQAAVGPKLTSRSFGKDWRYPITHKFNY